MKTKKVTKITTVFKELTIVLESEEEVLKLQRIAKSIEALVNEKSVDTQHAKKALYQLKTLQAGQFLFEMFSEDIETDNNKQPTNVSEKTDTQDATKPTNKSYDVFVKAPHIKIYHCIIDSLVKEGLVECDDASRGHAFIDLTASLYDNDGTLHMDRWVKIIHTDNSHVANGILERVESETCASVKIEEVC